MPTQAALDLARELGKPDRIYKFANALDMYKLDAEKARESELCAHYFVGEPAFVGRTATTPYVGPRKPTGETSSDNPYRFLEMDGHQTDLRLHTLQTLFTMLSGAWEFNEEHYDAVWPVADFYDVVMGDVGRLMHPDSPVYQLISDYLIELGNPCL